MHKHQHEHHHGGQSSLLFWLGLISLGIGFFLENTLPILANSLFVMTVLTTGQHVMVEGLVETIHETREHRKFLPNVHFLMTLATIGAMLIGKFEEAALLIGIFASAHYLEEYVENKSRKEISNLLKMQPTKARRVIENGSIEEVNVEQLQVGDTVQVLNGSQIPIDGVILCGQTLVNEATINGESMPKEKTIDDEVFAGTMNEGETIQIRVTKVQSETIFAKIIQIVNQSQQSVSKTASTIKRIEPKYVTVVLALFPVVLLFGMTVLNWDFSTALYRGMVYLIAVSPCALAASATPTTLAAISYLSKSGVLIKGGQYLSRLSELKAIAFDKTGTLTQGNPRVVDQLFLENREVGLKNILVAMEEQANHPLAQAIVRDIAKQQSVSLTTRTQVGIGLQAEYQGHLYQVAKASVFSLEGEWLEVSNRWATEGKTVIVMVEDQQVVAALALMDTPKETSKAMIDYFNQQGVHTTMITGDSQATGLAVAKAIGIKEVQANVLPEDKAQVIRQQQKKYGVTAMVGDGVNDAPALVTADIGVAMGNGTDIAVEFSDLVLMNDTIENIQLAHQVSRKMNKITWQNIAFSMTVVVTLVTLNFLGISDITMGVLLHEGSTVLVIVNALRMLISTK